MRMQVKYRTPETEKRLPLQHAKPGDCGYDLGYSPDPAWEPPGDGTLKVFPHTFKLVPTGVSVKIPDGFFGLLCGRSSTFGKRGLFVVESRIDSGYTGELFVKVWHPAVFGGDFQAPPGPAVIRPWERFAQIVVLPYVSPELEIVNELPVTDRGTSGFGSSGGFLAERRT
jgi:dUTP pyrophosphatase